MHSRYLTARNIWWYVYAKIYSWHLQANSLIFFRHSSMAHLLVNCSLNHTLRVFFFYKSDLRTAFYHDWQCGSQCFKKVQANTRESFVLLGNIDLFVRWNSNVPNQGIQPPSLSASLRRTHSGRDCSCSQCPLLSLCLARMQIEVQSLLCSTPPSSFSEHFLLRQYVGSKDFLSRASSNLHADKE